MGACACASVSLEGCKNEIAVCQNGSGCGCGNHDFEINSSRIDREKFTSWLAVQINESIAEKEY